jgi:ankyrin repeat protein
MVASVPAKQTRWAGLGVVCLLAAAVVVDGKEWAKGDKPSPPNAALLAGARNGENAEALKKHLEFGAAIDCKSEHGWTPLITAILGGKISTAEALVLRLCATCDCTRGLASKTKFSLSAVSRASTRNCSDCARMQIDMGASLTEADQEGDSPLHLALKNDHDEVHAIPGRCDNVTFLA